MRSLSYARLLSVVLMALVFGVVVAGCGDDDDPAATNPGAPAGATGDAAGGAAVEAGKQRTPEEVQKEKQSYSVEPPPVQLQSADKSGYKVSKPTIVMVRSESELSDIKAKLKTTGVNPEVAPVDFKTRQVVTVVFPKLPAGTLTQVVDIHEAKGKIIVSAVKVTPGKGCAGGKQNNPWAMVETRAMKGETTLTVSEVSNAPCKN